MQKGGGTRMNHEKLKQLYEQTVVPKEELAMLVDKTIETSRKRSKKPVRILSCTAAVVAAACISFVITLNVSPAFAKTLYDIPVLGDVCRVFTFREYHFEDDMKIVNVRVPKIENTGNTELERRVNAEISKRMDLSVKESEQRAKENYDAYIATGGNPDEYYPTDINVDYQIKSCNENTLSFVLEKYESQASFYSERFFYNLNLKTGEAFTLKDLLGPDYQQTVYQQVSEQMKHLDDDTKQLLFPDMFTPDLITEDRGFYLDENGNIVVVFEKYEIAAGAAGALEFPITNDGNAGNQ